jgi:formylglycine-generating enzyme required for sulfatase activity
MSRGSILAPIAIALLFLMCMQEPSRAEVGCDGVDTRVGLERGCLKPKDTFRDCPKCPEMVVAPAGSFTMGSPKDEPQREPFNKGSEDQLTVTIEKPFAVGRFAVTRGEFAAFVYATGRKTEGGCLVYTASEWKLQSDRNWRSPGFSQTDRHPVVCVNWEDSKAYVAWLSSITGRAYRLLSESEHEYAARAGSTTPFWWGSTISTSQANYNGNTYGDGSNADWRKMTVPVDSFAANAWGLYNVHGNVWDWTEDCWNASNAGNPGNGDARKTGDCNLRVLRGGSWGSHSQLLRSADRHWYLPSTRAFSCGLRVARTLD